MELILGIDDAGRGPVIGPMVLAGVLLDSKTESELKKLGVKDSKDLTPKRRGILAEKIKEKAETFEIEIISAPDIDDKNAQGIKLNEVEAFACANIINKINKGYKKIKVILDCPSVSLIKWGDFLKTKINNLSNLEIRCEHKADKNHVAVSAASIIAKETRESEMTKLKEKYGNEIGSGYCSDPLTQKFLEKFLHKYDNDGIFRKTWTTYKRAKEKLKQRKLSF
ncbi:ribonuclease HII [archaeon]|jgi:ribonuclease HII|nr:ribonuclease HII [archaeon]MBT4373375.1 ribonuclease HII [archaeon]MBT4531823.1 ribonuclease HII [archaeon]MBT7001490.1 ribonuclease HII [archaeon]MBT7282618.1 ribonuclease HII [archaeon]